MTRAALLIALSGALLTALAAPAAAQQLTLDFGDAGSLTSRVFQLMVLITVITLAPSILVMVTSFTRIVVVLSIMRSAIGVQGTPPNTVMISLALFLTAFIMAPTFEEAYDAGIRPLIEEEITEGEAFELTVAPLHAFMIRHVREKDLGLFLDMARLEPPESPATTPLRALIPAFVISELKRAFEIGFLVFVPFIIIDMVVASVLMSMGMMMLPPVMISLPFKLIFFVLVDGWHLITGSLVKSFGGG